MLISSDSVPIFQLKSPHCLGKETCFCFCFVFLCYWEICTVFFLFRIAFIIENQLLTKQTLSVQSGSTGNHWCLGLNPPEFTMILIKWDELIRFILYRLLSAFRIRFMKPSAFSVRFTNRKVSSVIPICHSRHTFQKIQRNTFLPVAF